MNSAFYMRWKRFIDSPKRLKAPVLNFLFAFLPEEFDRFLRKKEYQFHRLYRPYAENSYSRLASFLGTLSIIFLIYGPTLSWRGGSAFLLLCVSLLFNWSLSHWFKYGVKTKYVSASVSDWLKRNYLLAAQWLTIFLLCAFLWYMPWLVHEKEASEKIYRHALIPIIFFLFIITIPLAYLYAAYLFPPKKQEFHFSSLLDKTELVFDPRRPEITWGRVLRALLNAPFVYLLYLVFPASIAVIFIRHEETMHLVAGIFLLGMWIFLAFVGLHTRYAAMLTLWKRSLFIRAQLVVSLLVIGVAAGRLLGIDYVTTMIETIPAKVFFFYLFSLYSLLWFYGYWLNHILSERLFFLLGGENSDYPWSLRYQLADSEQFRYLQIHGGTRFIVIRPKRKSLFSVLGKDITIYERVPLFKKLVESAGSKTSLKIELGELIKRYNSYFSLMNIVAFLLFSFSFYILYQQDTRPEYKQPRAASRASGLLDLNSRIFNPEKSHQSVILLSASGGGTRAALFTASLLRGLQQINKLRDVALVSGVSGGGAALAFFASHYNELLQNQPTPENKSWNNFSDTMAKPFIQDVLEGMMEWRIVSNIRLGTLLKESFQREFGIDSENTQYSRTFGEVAEKNGLGIILNTSLAGHPYYITHTFANKRSRQNHSSAIYRGGRLIFTNLAYPSGVFDQRGLETEPDKRFKYVVVNSPDTNLATAAALNANFPPIFSNAAVDILNANNEYDRYWVTDGGAVDNRGAISLLLALRASLSSCLAKKQQTAIAPLDILIADASASSVDFSQNRGIATALSAAASIGNLLIEQLAEENRQLYTKACGGQAENFHLYYLSMPEALRARGGMGTHWLMPGEVTIYPVKCPDKDLEKNAAISLKGQDIKQIIDFLHQPRLLLDTAKKNEKMHSAVEIVLNSHHQKVWQEFSKTGILQGTKAAHENNLNSPVTCSNTSDKPVPAK